MSHPSLVLILLLLTNQVAAQEVRRESPASSDAVTTADDQPKKQKRDGLRETLKRPVDEVPAGARQLSPQEKTEMRQQLRKQFDLPK